MTKHERITCRAFEENLRTPRKVRRVPGLSYGSYLKVGELLRLQRPLSTPPHHDEMLFIVIHQVYELWFKQLLHELDATMVALDDDDLLRAAKRFHRMHSIQRLIEQQVDILETMAPQEFNQFRDNLNPASGFQSVQFRELEFAAGLQRTDVLQFIELDDAQRASLERRAKEPSLYDRVKALLARRGFAVASSEELVQSFRQIYSDEAQYYDLCLLLEDLIELDERFLLWRGRHIRMVERMIGQKHGTGGSPGARYLERTLEQRFFPELWEVRTYLGKGTGG
ncbi:MAG: tryptophan 2,3-dioxygenase [Candidatus Eremiobacteraeota bacterium]|nr:tryptophan 2,3-dioxygenase [Candidatus Eremiobacteraeota bacterium]